MPAERPGQEGGVRARNRRQRTADLCRAGLTLFREQGLEATTVDEITRAAGVSKGTFYRYFNGKAELVGAIFAPLEAALDAAMTRCREALEAASDAELEAAYARLAVELGAVLLGSPETVDLYLTESRGAEAPGREAIHRQRDEIVDAANDLSR
ncbi:MAG: helix-turn-helix domain-containing protein, partial [Polyangiaceae bacterium]